MSFSCGIVGLPNVGKSTLFNALTSQQVPAQNFPFCTVEPNVGVAALSDARLQRVAEVARSRELIPAQLRFVDIAGLIAGASRGEGLGNQFLGHIRECDCFAHVVRCFNDPDIAKVEGATDGIADIETIETELMLADLQSLERRMEKATRNAKGGGAQERAHLALLKEAHDVVGGGRALREWLQELEVADAERALEVRGLGLITAMPVIYVANVGEGEASGKSGEHIAKLGELAASQKAELVTLCASLEAEIAQLAEEERGGFLAELGMGESGLSQLARAGFQALGLQTFFTAGEKEARAWTIPMGADAKFAAGCVHSDFARGFIRAEVVSWEDFIACNGEQGAREAGCLRSMGAEYRVADGDVLRFRFNV